MSKKCKCGAEMARSSVTNYIPNCGYVTNVTHYCPVLQEQLNEAMKIGPETYHLLLHVTKDTHTEPEVTGPRW